MALTVNKALSKTRAKVQIIGDGNLDELTLDTGLDYHPNVGAGWAFLYAAYSGGLVGSAADLVLFLSSMSGELVPFKIFDIPSEYELPGVMPYGFMDSCGPIPLAPGEFVLPFSNCADSGTFTLELVYGKL